MEIAFDFREEKSDLFGRIFRPVVNVWIFNRHQVVQEAFYVDSGSDISLIPFSTGELLNLRFPQPKEISEIKGIGDSGVPITLRKVTIQLGQFRIQTKIGWALIEDVPFLLGREGFFKYFDITFSKNQKTIFRQ